MRFPELICTLLIGGLHLVVGGSHRLNRIHLVHRRANELERDARRRYSVTPSGPMILNGSASAEIDKPQKVLEECLEAFKVMIGDIVRSSCSDRQLEQVANILEKVNLVESLSWTFTKLVFDVVSVTNIDVSAYTAIFASDLGVYIVRSLQLSASMGLSWRNMVVVEAKNSVQLLEEMERQLDLFLQAPNNPPSDSFHKILLLTKYSTSGKRSDLMMKIRESLPAETRIVFEPLLLQFIDEYVTQLDCYRGGNTLLDKAEKSRLMHFLEIQIDGFLGVIKRGEALISLSDFISSQVDQASHHQHLRFLTVRMSYEFASRFGVDILAQRRDLSEARIALLTQLVAAYVHLGPGFIPCYNPNLETLPNEKLRLMVAKLSHIVSWRETYLSQNQDPPLELDRANEWHQYMLDPKYDYKNNEAYLNIITNCEFPERITNLSLRLMSLYRQYRRGPLGNACRNAASCLPVALMRLEIESGVVDAEDPRSLLLREYLEAVFMDMADLLELAGLKLITDDTSSWEYSNIVFDMNSLKLVFLNTDLQDSDSGQTQHEDVQSQTTRSSQLDDADFLFVNLSEDDWPESHVDSHLDDLNILAHNKEEGCGVDLTGLSSFRDQKMKKVDLADIHAKLSALSARIQALHA